MIGGIFFIIGLVVELFWVVVFVVGGLLLVFFIVIFFGVNLSSIDVGFYVFSVVLMVIVLGLIFNKFSWCVLVYIVVGVIFMVIV